MLEPRFKVGDVAMCNAPGYSFYGELMVVTSVCIRVVEGKEVYGYSAYRVADPSYGEFYHTEDDLSQISWMKKEDDMSYETDWEIAERWDANLDARKKWYKICRVKEGKTVSLVDWKDYKGIRCLEYKTGKITYAPEGTPGIFVVDSVKKAQEQRKYNGDRVPCVTYEVTPLGEEITREEGLKGLIGRKDKGLIGWKDDDYHLFPAVLVGSEVDITEPPAPKEKWEWVDVTKECSVALSPLIGAFYYCELRHNQTTVAWLAAREVPCDANLVYKVEFLDVPACEGAWGGFKVYHLEKH